MDVRRHWWWRSASSKMKEFILCICVLTLLATGACSTLVTAPLNGTATIPCNAPQSETTKRPLEVYWQKQSLPSSDVVFVTLDGQEISEHQTKKYVNRTRQDPNDLVLYLDQVTVADEGTYECIVNHIPGEYRDPVHKAYVQLKVLANFSSPELTQEPKGKVKNGTTVTLTCFSNEGYPAATDVVLIESSGNESTELKGKVQTAQDTSTKLFNITGTFLLNFTKNVNLSCTIHQAESLGSVSSRTVSLEVEIAENRNRMVSIIVITVALLMAVAATLLIKYHRKCCKSKDAVKGVKYTKSPGNAEELSIEQPRAPTENDPNEELETGRTHIRTPNYEDPDAGGRKASMDSQEDIKDRLAGTHREDSIELRSPMKSV